MPASSSIPGLRGDGLSDDSEALQRALDARPALLEIPAGRYKIGRTLRFPSGTRLKADPGAHFFLADGAARTGDDYLAANADPAGGNADISIEGGLWDGNNRGNPRPGGGLFAEGYTGAMLHFESVSGLRLSGLRLRNAEAYYARFTAVRDFHIEGIRFSSENVRHNNDGIHLGGFCEDGVIRDIKGEHPGVTGDDLVALNADDAPNRNEVRGMRCGPIRNIRIEDLEAEGCHSFVRMLSVWSAIENVTVRKVRGSCDIAALNCDAARGCRVTLFDEAAPPFPDGVGLLRNIDAADFHVSKSAANAISLLRLETRMENFRIADFRRDAAKDKSPDQPALRLRLAAVPRFRLEPGGVARGLAFGETFEWDGPRLDSFEAGSRD